MNKFKRIPGKKNLISSIIRAALWTAVVFLVGIAIWMQGSVSAGGDPVGSKDVDLWQDVDERLIELTGQRQIVPQKYRTLRLDVDALRKVLGSAPAEFSREARTQETILTLPLPDGGFSRFRIEDSPIMHPDLAARYPEIKTYRGQGIDDPTAMLRFDLTPQGFHAQILRAGTSVYIDPYAKGDVENYIAYLKTDFRATGKRLICGVSGRTEKPKFWEEQHTGNITTNAGTLRTYRLALAATVEYTAFHGNTKASALAAQVTSMNRVNGIYERDISLRMILVANNDAVIYVGAPASDPYTNDDGSAMLDENQATLDSVIGNANYDIGHVFSTGGGGVAYLESPCNAGIKAQGVTGNPAPVGDSFDVDYVAHEMGHQWGGDHTFNGTTLSCAPPNRSIFATVEPGSGITIQAYAGICETQDLAPHSIDHFHVYSLEEIVNYTTAGAGNNCDVPIPVSNTAPTVSTPASFTIPKLTPFRLTATATDAEDAGLTYNWEEYMTLAPPSPPDDDIDGLRPIFRSYSSTTNPTRTFPSMQYVLNNGNIPPTTYDCGRVILGVNEPCLTGEALPAFSGSTRIYQVTVRDNHSGGGGIRSVQTEVNISAAGPFKVTAPDSNVTWGSGSMQTVTWLAAGTDLPPIGAANVNIRLSTDGGLTFPTVLKSNTPNDGTESVLIPNTPTSSARIMIEAANNIFFDVSDTNFAIAPPTNATASVGGRITRPDGNGVRGVIVRLVGDGINLTAITNAFGYYRFDDIPTGTNYLLTPSHKTYQFDPPSQFFTLMEDEESMDFSGNSN